MQIPPLEKEKMKALFEGDAYARAMKVIRMDYPYRHPVYMLKSDKQELIQLFDDVMTLLEYYALQLVPPNRPDLIVMDGNYLYTALDLWISPLDNYAEKTRLTAFSAKQAFTKRGSFVLHQGEDKNEYKEDEEIFYTVRLEAVSKLIPRVKGDFVRESFVGPKLRNWKALEKKIEEELWNR